MPRSLADGHKKLTILTEAPANPDAPTAAELNAGIDASCNILASDFSFGAADSDKLAEKALCTESNANSLGAGNYVAAMTFFRYFDETTKNPDATEDVAFEAAKIKGTELWIYGRATAKKSTEAWATGDEIFHGAYVITDNPQAPSDQGGYIKYRVGMETQEAYPFIEVAAA